MVFQFEHVEYVAPDSGTIGKWADVKPPMKGVRAILNKWQQELEGVAWNSLYFCNHDQPRSVSKFGDDSDEYREVSAKMLATCPYVYQGEDLGMTNANFQI